MASVIKIKRSSTAASPTTLASGELAYSWFNDTNKLYFGKGDNGSGGASNIVTIGGEYYTKYLDHTPGTLTASAAILVDANKKINELLVDNLSFDGNTISSTNTDGNIVLDPDGNGLVSINSAYTLPGVDGSTGYVLTTNGSGVVSWAAPAANLTVGADTNADSSVALLTESLDIAGGVALTSTVTKTGTVVTVTLDLDNTAVTTGSYGSSSRIPTFTVDAQGRLTAAGEVDVATNLTVVGDNASDDVSLLTEDLKILGGEGIDTALTTVGTDVIITISGEDATDTNKGIASFSSSNFTVTSGAVATKDITLGTSTLTNGTTTSTLAGLQQLTVDNIDINGNEISATNTSGSISLRPSGTGTIQVNNTRITGLAEPVDPQDAATKYYVDAARSGLDIKQSVKVATTENITLSGAQTIDGVALASGDRVLVKDQTDKTQNGIYVLAGESGDVWTRASDADNTPAGEVTSGMFCFVEQGTINSDTGFVLTTNDPIILDTSELDFTLFSTSGTLIAGNGLSKNGYTLEVNVAANGGIEISGDNLQLKSSVAGDGLTYTTGVLAVGGTADRISVTADAVDIASTYAGQTSITTLGTIATGTWNGTTIAVANGGTGITTATARGILYGNTADPLGVTAASSIDGSFLREDATGNPYFSNVIDGGTY
jgi:hypothetical protein